MSVNKVILIGNLGKDPDIRATEQGKEIANFSLATTESWKDKSTGEKKEKTEWHKIVVFSQGLVGIIKQYVKKGSKLYIEGQLQTRKYTDKQGVDKYITEIVLQNFNSTLQMLGSRSSSEIPNNLQEEKMTPELIDALDKQNNNQEFTDNIIDDEIPF
jgi:single-strand DNA-binding protein